MKKLFLLMVAAICSLTMSAKPIFLDTGGTALWGQDNATFFIWSWGETPGALHALTPIAGDIYAADIDDGETYLLFARMPEGTTEETFDWANAMNQTADLEIPTTSENLYVITGWTAAEGYWTVYAPSFVCIYTLKMTDSYGDGWNGGELTVIDAAIEQTFTLSSGSEETVNVKAYGGTPQWIFTKGSFPSEIGYVITDVNGLVLASHTAGTTHEMEFTTADPCEIRTAPALPSYVQVNTEDNISFSFEWEAVAGVDNYYVMILNPGNNVSIAGVVAGNTLSRDFSDRTINGTYTIEVIPANADGLPYYENGTIGTFELKLPAVGIVKTRFFVPSDSELDMTQQAVIGLEGTDGISYEADATQEAGTRWWSAEVYVDAPAYYYAQMMVGNTEATTVYVPYQYFTSSKETELCLTVGSWESDFVDGGITYKYYNVYSADCDMKESQIASVTLTPGEGEIYYTIVPDGERATYYDMSFYVDGSYYGGVTVSNLEGRINVTIASDITFSGFTVTPLDENGNKVGATYESTVPFTITPSPYNITGLAADPVGDNTYKITWDVPSKLPPMYNVYIRDADYNTLLNKSFDASELTQEGGKFVLVSPTFAVEGGAYAKVQVRYGEDDWGPSAYTNFDVSGLVSISDATIRVLIPTDNNMDISNGVWFWWWPVGTSTGSLVKATPESGRWFSADIQPNALGYQFLVVNKEIKTDADWDDAQQSYDSRICGGGTSCLALASKYTYAAKHKLYDVECNAPDHDYRPTLSFDNSVAQKITVTAEAKEYAPNYEIAWGVKDSGDGYEFEAHHMTATNHTFTLDIPVTEDTEIEYIYYVNNEDWYLMVEDIQGTFTVKATSAEPEYPPFNLAVTVAGQVAKLTWSAPLEVEYCVLNVTDPLSSTDVVYEEVTGLAGEYSYEYTFADGDERTLEWGVFSRIGYKAVSGWVYGDDFQAEGSIPAYYNIDNLTATAVGDNTYKISWDAKSGVYQYYVFVEDADGNTLVEDAFLTSELSVEGGKYVFVTPAFAVEGEASAHVWSGDNESNWYKDAIVLFDVTGLSKLTSSKIRVLIPTDNNMDISAGVWFWWWPAGTTDGQIVAATQNGHWFEADITLNAAGYQFLVVNKEIKTDADWTGAQQSEDSPIITSDEACFELLYNLNAEKWKLAADDACDNVDHDYRFTVNVDNTTAGRLLIELNAVDYAPVYVVYYRIKGTTAYTTSSYEGASAMMNTLDVAIGTTEDTEIEYLLYALDKSGNYLAAPAVGEVTVLANPNIPLNLSADVNGQDVTFSWEPQGSNWASFEVKVYTSAWNLYKKVSGITSPTTTITFDDNDTYQWALSTFDASDNLLGTIMGPDFTVNYVPGPTTYTLTIAADAHGSVNTAVNGTYNEGDVVKIIATPDDGYKFDKWSDDDTHATRNITMNKDYNLTAYFTKDEGGGGGEDPDYYTLTVEVDPAGAATVYFDGDKVKKNELEVEEGTVVTLTFEEEEGYEFDYWQDGKSKVTKSKYKVTVNDDMTIILHMIPAQAIENVEDATKPTKVLRNGTIYIFREGKTYTITGAKVE